jgi:uncharacterized membrane protein YgaE (UPF0421/DUF939 family)
MLLILILLLLLSNLGHGVLQVDVLAIGILHLQGIQNIWNLLLIIFLSDRVGS